VIETKIGLFQYPAFVRELETLIDREPNPHLRASLLGPTQLKGLS
jgi:hypothetical protein